MPNATCTMCSTVQEVSVAIAGGDRRTTGTTTTPALQVQSTVQETIPGTGTVPGKRTVRVSTGRCTHSRRASMVSASSTCSSVKFLSKPPLHRTRHIEHQRSVADVGVERSYRRATRTKRRFSSPISYFRRRRKASSRLPRLPRFQSNFHFKSPFQIIMSLATAGGGLGGGMGGAAGGGLTMAHQASAMARPTAPPQGSAIPDSAGMAPPSTSAAALGADLVDKQQQLSLQQVKDLSKMPLVAIDLYASEPHVAAFPPKPTELGEAVAPYLVGKMKDKVALKTTETSHKTFRKWLSQSKGYLDLKADVLAKLDDESAVVIESPQRWLGLRRLDDAPEDLRTKFAHNDESDSPAIAEEATQEIGIIMANGTLDGSVPQGDDFDRVVSKLKLHASKKALTILPEEMTGLLISIAQHHVARATKVDEDDEDIDSYPCAVAVPAVYCYDSSIESLLEAMGGTGVVFQRSMCALAGALLPSPDESKPNTLIEHLGKVMAAMHKEHQKNLVKNPDLVFEEDMLLLLTGVTNDCAECTAVQISAPRHQDGMWGNFKVLTNVSYRHENPESITDKCISELFDTLDTVAPEAGGPVAMVSYGTTAEQKTIHIKWEKLKNSLEDWEEVPHFFSNPNSIALGTAVMGAVSHGRITNVVQKPGKKPKAELAIQVQNVSPVAVGVMINYHGGAKDKWTPVKTIFDFDRRVPAGPYPIDLVAAECVVHRSKTTKDLSDEELLKAIKDNEGAKCIPKREQAALDLRVQVLQKWTRDGAWKNVGDVMSPLVSLDKDEKKVACEKIVLELSLGATGMITSSLSGTRYVPFTTRNTCCIRRLAFLPRT